SFRGEFPLRYWTISAWQNGRALHGFVRADPHRTVTAALPATMRRFPHTPSTGTRSWPPPPRPDALPPPGRPRPAPPPRPPPPPGPGPPGDHARPCGAVRSGAAGRPGPAQPPCRGRGPDQADDLGTREVRLASSPGKHPPNRSGGGG